MCMHQLQALTHLPLLPHPFASHGLEHELRNLPTLWQARCHAGPVHVKRDLQDVLGHMAHAASVTRQAQRHACKRRGPYAARAVYARAPPTPTTTSSSMMTAQHSPLRYTSSTACSVVPCVETIRFVYLSVTRWLKFSVQVPGADTGCLGFVVEW